MSSETPTELVLRPAVAETDTAAVARVHLASRAAAVTDGAMPPSVHGDDEASGWVAGWIDAADVWVAEVDHVVVAYLRLTDDWLDDLYVVPEHAGLGIGTALLEIAKVLRPAGFGLWVFEVNMPARAFYARHGLVEVARTDGADNEEQAPDLHLEWQP